MKTFLFLSSLLVCFSISKAQLTYNLITNGLNAVPIGDGSKSQVAVGDVDNDGDLDLVSIGDHGSGVSNNGGENGIMVWKNNGSGTAWSFSQSGFFGYGGCVLGDVNNDGKMDIGMSMHHDYATSGVGMRLIDVGLGNGTGNSWTPYDSGLAINGENYGMFNTDFSDVNSDGLLDIGANSFGCCSGIHIYKNNGNGTWTQTWGVLGGNAAFDFKFGDFDNDGNPDLVVANEWGVIWRNNGAGQFNQSQMQTGFSPSSATNYCEEVQFDIADVNNDGAVDIARTGWIVNNSLKIFTYNKLLSQWDSTLSNGLPSSGVIEVSLADMDMDGNCDAIAYMMDSILIYKGDGAGNWILAGKINTGDSFYAGVNTGDFDHDGYTDICYIGAGTVKVWLHKVDNPALSILPNYPKGNECFQPHAVQFIKWISSVPSGPAAHVTIDFSSSGNSGPWTNVVSNYPNSGVYQWTTPNVSSTNCYLRFIISNGSSTQTVILSSAFGIGSCTTPTSASEENNDLDFSVYPNPSNGQFVIASPAFDGINSTKQSQITIYNSLGEIIFNKNSKGKEEINLDAASGIYFLQIKTSSGVSNRKIAIEK